MNMSKMVPSALSIFSINLLSEEFYLTMTSVKVIIQARRGQNAARQLVFEALEPLSKASHVAHLDKLGEKLHILLLNKHQKIQFFSASQKLCDQRGKIVF